MIKAKGKRKRRGEINKNNKKNVMRSRKYMRRWKDMKSRKYMRRRKDMRSRKYMRRRI